MSTERRLPRGQRIALASILAWGALAALLPGQALAQQQAQPPRLIGATLVQTHKPARGFVDDPFAFDSTGKRLLYINSDAGSRSELHVVDLTQNSTAISTVPISQFTTMPVHARLLEQGFFVVSRLATGKQRTGAIISSDGAVTATFGPADDVVLLTGQGEPVVVTYSLVEERAPRPGTTSYRHTVTLWELDGKRQRGKPRVLISDDKGHVPELDLRMAYWADSYTRLVGITDSGSARQEEAWYDVIAGTIRKRVPIADMVEHAQRTQLLAQHAGEPVLAISGLDAMAAVELVTESGRMRIELPEPLRHYAPTSLHYQPLRDGVVYFSLEIDPAHADAAARKQLDPAYLDLYEYRVGDKQARRRARILLTSKRKLSWRATHEHWAVMPRLVGVDRGGTEIQIYKLD